VEQAGPDGLVAVSEEINVEYLLSAYTHGIFPWPFDQRLIPWVSPPERAVLFFREFKIPSSLKRELKKKDFHFAVNRNFTAVIRACAQIRRKHGGGTWITEKMIRAYGDFHQAGYAVSFETYDAGDHLVGGLYGVLINKYFGGESMFYQVGGASKYALVQTIRHLEALGLTWIDIQVMTPLFRHFGAKLLPRSEFLQLLHRDLLREKAK
jgi:leucyl/phenylalanyl-tRNA--protein transferase